MGLPHGFQNPLPLLPAPELSRIQSGNMPRVAEGIMPFGSRASIVEHVPAGFVHLSRIANWGPLIHDQFQVKVRTCSFTPSGGAYIFLKAFQCAMCLLIDNSGQSVTEKCNAMPRSPPPTQKFSENAMCLVWYCSLLPPACPSKKHKTWPS